MKKTAWGAAIKIFGIYAYLIFIFVLAAIVGGKGEAAPRWIAPTLFFLFVFPAMGLIAYEFIYIIPKELYNYFKEKIEKVDKQKGE